MDNESPVLKRTGLLLCTVSVLIFICEYLRLNPLKSAGYSY
jgi:hypothetical protein